MKIITTKKYKKIAQAEKGRYEDAYYTIEPRSYSVVWAQDPKWQDWNQGKVTHGNFDTVEEARAYADKLVESTINTPNTSNLDTNI